MLLSLSVKNFRSCEDARILLKDPVVTLVGKNGVGKTNVLHAIQLACELCVGPTDAIQTTDVTRVRSAPLEMELAFEVNGVEYVYSTSRIFPSPNQALEEQLSRRAEGQAILSRDGELVLVHNRANEVRVSPKTGALPAILQLLPSDDPLVAELLGISNYLTNVRYYPVPHGYQEHTYSIGAEDWLIELSRYEQFRANLKSGVGGNRSATMRILHMYLNDRAKFQELQTLIGSDGLDLISEIRVDEVTLRHSPRPSAPADINVTENTEPAYTIYFMPGSGLAGAKRHFRYKGLSSGTWRTIRLLTYLVFDQASCMLLEQPEDFIHPGLLEKLIDIIKSYSSQTQVITTTHSSKVMNLVGPSGVRIVTATDGRTQVEPLTDDERGAAHAYIKDCGTLSEFLETL